jgi:TRAP transporter 4TM/12TM fusion protein
MEDLAVKDVKDIDSTRYTHLGRSQRVFFLILSAVGIALGGAYLLGYLHFQGKTMLSFGYNILFIGLFIAGAFLILPARKKDKGKLPWYDFLLAFLTLGVCLYFYSNSEKMMLYGWSHIPLGIVLAILVLEAGRRAGGWVYLIVTAFFGLYPLFAAYMPGILGGISRDLTFLVKSSVFYEEGLMGIPTKVAAQIIIGFLVFAGVLIASGAGAFFLNLANGLLGRYRGGPAKVAVLSSAFFGSLSGSVMSNVIATGSVTIPTMKRIGYPPHYAGAIEACASTGGVLMPPVMGAVAFIMCEIIGMDYSRVIVAALIPSVLYYFGLLMQVDAYAVRVELRGIPREEVPSLRKTFKEGWHFIAVLVFLLWGLLYMRWSYLSPWYASALMFLLSFVRKETMMTPRRTLEALATIGRLVAQTAALILPIGFIYCGLNITGVAGAFTAGLVTLGGGNIFLILLLGVAACYIMGMAGIVTAAYIFLAVTLAPAAIKLAGLNIMAVHLFIIYYAMLAGITPPVAGAAFIGASIAGSNPMKTAFQSMRLGIVIYFIPFFFVFNPSLVLQGSLLEALYLMALCLVGITLIAAGCEGYLLKVGKVESWGRIPLVIAGILIGFPEWKTTIAGAILTLLILVGMWVRKSRKKQDIRLKPALDDINDS